MRFKGFPREKPANLFMTPSAARYELFVDETYGTKRRETNSGGPATNLRDLPPGNGMVGARPSARVPLMPRAISPASSASERSSAAEVDSNPGLREALITDDLCRRLEAEIQVLGRPGEGTGDVATDVRFGIERCRNIVEDIRCAFFRRSKVFGSDLRLFVGKMIVDAGRIELTAWSWSAIV